MKFTTRVGFVTGWVQGLGKAIALAPAKEGAEVVICDITELKPNAHGAHCAHSGMVENLNRSRLVQEGSRI